jgi:hypothetical protein
MKTWRAWERKADSGPGVRSPRPTGTTGNGVVDQANNVVGWMRKKANTVRKKHLLIPENLKISILRYIIGHSIYPS